MSKTCEDCGNATCVCEGIGKMLTEAKCGTCGRDMNDAYNRLLCREHFTASIAALISELAEARRQLGEAETRIATYQAERDLACTALADTARERDAYRDSKRLGAWQHQPERPWGHMRTIEEWGRPGPVFVGINMVRRADGSSEAWGSAPGLSMSFPNCDTARAFIDAHLAGRGYWLEDGPHGAGEAK